MTVRISGFSSGLDIDSLVTQLMKAERTKLDKLTQKKTTIEWQQEQFRDISTSLVDFRNNKLSKYNTLNALSAKTSTISGDKAAVSVTSTNSAATGSLSVKVTDLASSASYVAQSKATSGVTGATKLKELFGDATKLTVTDSLTGSPVEFAIDGEATVSSLVSAVNGNKALNVTMMVGSNGEVSIRSNTTGSRTLSMSALDETDASNPQQTLTLSSSASGTDAKALINGVLVTSSTNSISTNGYNLQLDAVTETGKETVVSSKLDVDSIMNTIKSFISDYNTVLDQINTKLGEARYRNYSPLSDEQKEGMKESQVTLWEERAKSGLLRNDTTLSSLVSNMRLALVSTVDTGDSAVKTVQSIGIVTGLWSDKGKLIIEDEDKLRAAIEANPEAVIKLFNGGSANADSKTITTNPNVGIFNRLSNLAMTSLQQLSERVGTSAYSSDKNGTFLGSSMLGEQLRQLDTKITNMNRYLTNKENQYYKQFTAMETAINKYSSQASSFSSY
ncbi:flagellar filament capping protein FliD [Paenibacillus sp. B01]|uniref:flagellar filament capping protein FliD n=1 Tax=Paenibacillus sp. B01 TaxID=2660554 RepID=UPI00129A8A1A|nr:flagellar filament capping protein FliD [Paenibacillus sp. B01]QGG58093.1 flagellar filament capping protein FliD [Paenibacillus sp. B01]